MEFVQKAAYDSTNILVTENNDENDDTMTSSVYRNNLDLWTNIITDKFRLFWVKTGPKWHHQDALVMDVERR